MRKSQIRHLEQILARKRYGTFFLGHPVHSMNFMHCQGTSMPSYIPKWYLYLYACIVMIFILIIYLRELYALPSYNALQC